MSSNKKKNYPFIQIYVKDWLADSRLKYCNYAEKGLLFDLICQMHQSENYGYLMFGDEFATYDEILHAFSGGNGQTPDYIKGLFDKLLKLGVISQITSRDKKVVFCSNRMIIDEKKRTVNSDNGKKGGNPDLIAVNRSREAINQSQVDLTESQLTKKEEPVNGRLETRTSGEPSAVDPGSFVFSTPSKRFVIEEYEVDNLREQYSTLDIDYRLNFIQKNNYAKDKEMLGTSTNVGAFIKQELNKAETEVNKGAKVIIPLQKGGLLVINNTMLGGYVKNYPITSKDAERILNEHKVFLINNPDQLLNRKDAINYMYKEVAKHAYTKKEDSPVKGKRRKLTVEDMQKQMEESVAMGFCDDPDLIEMFSKNTIEEYPLTDIVPND